MAAPLGGPQPVFDIVIWMTLSAVEDALTNTIPFGIDRSVTKTRSLARTPVALVQFVLLVVEAFIEAGSKVHVPKRSAVTLEPSAPIVIPALDVVVPVTPKATYGVVLATPTLVAAITRVVLAVPTTSSAVRGFAVNIPTRFASGLITKVLESKLIPRWLNVTVVVADLSIVQLP